MHTTAFPCRLLSSPQLPPPCHRHPPPPLPTAAAKDAGPPGRRRCQDALGSVVGTAARTTCWCWARSSWTTTRPSQRWSSTASWRWWCAPRPQTRCLRRSRKVGGRGRASRSLAAAALRNHAAGASCGWAAAGLVQGADRIKLVQHACAATDALGGIHQTLSHCCPLACRQAHGAWRPAVQTCSHLPACLSRRCLPACLLCLLCLNHVHAELDMVGRDGPDDQFRMLRTSDSYAGQMGGRVAEAAWAAGAQLARARVTP